MSKLVFQFRKKEYKKTFNILKNGFTNSILKNTKKKSIFLKLKQTHPLLLRLCINPQPAQKPYN
jgi:hypothetical protein